MSGHQVVEADLTWTGHRFEAGVQVEIDLAGRIARVGRLGARARRLTDRALLPGFVNAHSHAFQRGLRGLGETFPAGAGSFWTWREAMYELVEQLTPDRFLDLTTAAFREMRAAGVTTVGEFHYVRHLGDLDFELDRLVIEAARAVGLRLALLPTYYRTGGIGQPLGRGQRRFSTPTPEAYWRSLDALQAEAGDLVTVGTVVHSLRAADPGEIAEIHAESVRRGLVFHIHVEEQRREIEECLAAHGVTPMRALLGAIGSAANVTAIHCTHTSDHDRLEFLDRGGRICCCPLTEGNLGDGIPALAGVAIDRLCLGTDSNARIDLVEECRWLEYGQRLAGEARGMVKDAHGSVGPALLRIATAGGAEALGLATGRIAPGFWADLQALDLTAPDLAGAGPDALVDAWLFGASGVLVAETCVAGRWKTRRPS